MISKKSQITVFIIIGIVLLLSSALVFYIKDEILNIGAEVKLTQEVPFELEPIKNYIVECVKEVSTTGIQKLGSQGGYMSLEDNDIPTHNPDPTESEAVDFFGKAIPYWWHMSDSNNCLENCQYTKRIPSLRKEDGAGSFEEQIEDYVKTNLEDCLQGFAPFIQEKFEITELGEILVDTSITTNDVDVFVEYPISVKRFAETGGDQISQFFIELPINLEKVYNLANDITNNQAENSFLEKNTLSWVQIFSGAEPDKLPPFQEVLFECGSGPIWTKVGVEQDLQNLLTVYTPLLGVFGTINQGDYEFNNEIATGIYSNMIMAQSSFLYPENSSSDGLAAYFDFLDWPYYLNTIPNDGGIMQSTDFDLRLPGLNFCMHNFRFVYDISHPVVVRLEDPKAFSGEGYEFSFALESNIRRNLPLDTDQVIEEFTPLFDSSIFCNVEQRLSGTISIEIIDGMTNESVSGANILLCLLDGSGSCVESCNMGSTASKLETEFPIASGMLLISKTGYHDKGVAFASSVNKSENLTIVIEPFRETTFTIKKKKIFKDIFIEDGVINREWTYHPEISFPLSYYDTATLTIEKFDPGEFIFTRTVALSGEEEGIIELVPGNYRINAIMMNEEDLVIPEDEICWDDQPFNPFNDDTCETIDRVELESWISGGIKIDENNYLWNLTKEELDNNDNLVFYIIGPDKSGFSKHGDLEQFDAYSDLSDSERDTINPEFE